MDFSTFSVAKERRQHSFVRRGQRVDGPRREALDFEVRGVGRAIGDADSKKRNASSFADTNKLHVLLATNRDQHRIAIVAHEHSGTLPYSVNARRAARGGKGQCPRVKLH
jgi:hypothetical protein